MRLEDAILIHNGFEIILFISYRYSSSLLDPLPHEITQFLKIRILLEVKGVKN
jgi:hypothetical protein